MKWHKLAFTFPMAVYSSILICLACFSPQAAALCSAADATLTFDNSIIIQRDTPIGAVVATGVVITPIKCDPSGSDPSVGDGSWRVYLSSANSDYGVTSIAGVRATPIAGLGIKWTNFNSRTGTNEVWTGRALNAWAEKGRGITYNGVTNFTDTFQLIKVGPVSSGILPAWNFLYRYRTMVSNTTNTALNTISLAPVPVTVISCAVTQSSIPVSLGDTIRVARFTGIGSTSDDVPFSIPLDCDANAKVNFQLDGMGTATQGVLALNSVSGSASGVGVQVLYKGSPVTFGSKVLDGTAMADGPYTVDFLARYYQTGATVTGGPAQATATFTMTYQ